MRLDIVILFELHALDSMISEVVFKWRFSNSEQSKIGVMSIIPTIGWIKNTNDDPLERVNSPNSSDSDDIINFELDDHPFPPESINISLWTVDSIQSVVYVVIPLYDSS